MYHVSVRVKIDRSRLEGAYRAMGRHLSPNRVKIPRGNLPEFHGPTFIQQNWSHGRERD